MAVLVPVALVVAPAIGLAVVASSSSVMCVNNALRASRRKVFSSRPSLPCLAKGREGGGGGGGDEVRAGGEEGRAVDEGCGGGCVSEIRVSHRQSKGLMWW